MERMEVREMKKQVLGLMIVLFIVIGFIPTIQAAEIIDT